MVQNISTYDKFFYTLAIPIKNGLNELYAIRRVARNWAEVALFRAGIGKKAIIHFKNNSKVEIKSHEEYFDFLKSPKGQEACLESLGLEKPLAKTLSASFSARLKRYQKVDWSGFNDRIKIIEQLIKLQSGKRIKITQRIVVLKLKDKEIMFCYDSAMQLNYVLHLIYEQFLKDDQYSVLRGEGHVVVDIGASIGDTAIYFVRKGATHVYAFEPYPDTYRTAKRNLELNKITDKVTLLNEGCGKRSTVKINPSSGALEPSKTGKIKINSLAELTKRYQLKDAILKMDCEGCEYEAIIDATPETLRKFSQIAVEYHSGYLDIKTKLENSGFRILQNRITRITSMSNDLCLGHIFAVRLS